MKVYSRETTETVFDLWVFEEEFETLEECVEFCSEIIQNRRGKKMEVNFKGNEVLIKSEGEVWFKIPL